MENQKKEKINKKTKKLKVNIKSLSIDKAEYQEIILSNSNHPDKDFYKNY